MTTAATVVGHFPLVLATGPGAGARNSIGIMLVSGMIIGTVFTLFVGAVDLHAGGAEARCREGFEAADRSGAHPQSDPSPVEQTCHLRVTQ